MTGGTADKVTRPLSSLCKSISLSAHGEGAPAQQQGSPDISLLSEYLQSQWDHDGNSHLGNIVIKPRSGLKASWICDQCPEGFPHRWETTVQQRQNGSGCPYCSGKKVCPHNSLAKQAPHIAQEWDPAKNPKSPHDFTSRSGHRAHWTCQQGHEWQACIDQRVSYSTQCPACAQRTSRQPLVTSNPKVIRLWDERRNAQEHLDPSKLTCGSGRLAHFVCHQCPEQQPHRWQAPIYNVAR